MTHSLILLDAAAAPSALPQILLMVGIMVVFYIFMIHPQIKRQKKEKAFRENLKKGDRVITIGGVHGKILNMEETTVLIEVDDNVKVRVEKSALREAPTTATKAA